MEGGGRSEEREGEAGERGVDLTKQGRKREREGGRKRESMYLYVVFLCFIEQQKRKKERKKERKRISC